MAVDVTLLNSNSLNNIQENFERIEEALQDTVGRSGDFPNHMNSDLDMNDNDILNLRSLEVDTLIVDGNVVQVSVEAYTPADNSISTIKLQDEAVTTDKIADGSITGDKLADGSITINNLTNELLLSLATVSPTRSILKDLDTTRYNVSFLSENGREGVFFWKTGDYSSQIASDTMEGIYLKADAIDADIGAWVRIFNGLANVKWFGAIGDFSHDDTANLQAATDLCTAVFIPEGQYRTTSVWLLDDHAVLRGEGKLSIIRTNSNIDIIAGRGTSTYNGGTSFRNYRISIYNLVLTGPAKDSGQAGINFESVTDGKVWDVEINYIQYGVKNGGPLSSGAFYNDFHSVSILTCNTGYSNGTLGNHIQVIAGRVTDVLVGSEDYDNSDNTYDMVAFEHYTTVGSRISHNTQTSQRIRFINCRYESGSLTPNYGIIVNANSQNAIISGPTFILAGVVADYLDSGVSTSIVSPYI